MTNKQIAKALKLAAQLGELHDENPFKTKALSSAAFHIERLETEVAQLAIGDLEKIPGLGKSTVQKIVQLLETGTFDELERRFNETPIGVMQMLTIKGIGAKKVRALWTELEIESIGELLYACNENRLVSLKGFGQKTQEQIIQSIKFIEENSGKIHFAEAEQVFLHLKEILETKNSSLKLTPTGDIRRKTEVVESIDIIVSGAFDSLVSAIQSFENIEIKKQNDVQVHAVLAGKYSISFFKEDEKSKAYQLYMTTGPEAFLVDIADVADKNTETEEQIFAAKSLPFILPELRDNTLETAIKLSRNSLIKNEDIKGILHCHSKYSDGANTLKEMAEACLESGYTYFGICDHSQSAQYAGGLKPDEVLKQHEEIEKLNKSWKTPFKVLKGIESDILFNGQLDYEPEILQKFDFVVASVHSNLKMNEEKAMQRVIAAIENSYTNILGHPTGRLLLSRAGYPIDHKKVIDACAANKVAIELNAHPYRLDIDWRWIPYCMEKGVMISINPDAHEIKGLADVQYGVNVARKGGLTPDFTLNCLSLEDIILFFDKS
jgi:DNA polymerase (family 10)